MFSRDETSSADSFVHFTGPQHLENIEEDAPLCKPLRRLTFQPPETPDEPMEFLSRSWSISAVEVAKAIDARRKSVLDPKHRSIQVSDHPSREPVTPPFAFASTMTAQIVMERILANQTEIQASSRRKSLISTGPANYIHTNCPNSPLVPGDELVFCRSFSTVRYPWRELSKRRWLKDMKEKKKEANRANQARVHAAVSVAGVAAAVAAIAAATMSTTANSAGTGDDAQSKTSAAVASAAALVAAQCVEVAESMGADRAHISSVMSSAVSVKTPGDIITLTAAAATALRGAATLNASAIKDAASLATFLPRLEQGVNTIADFPTESVSEDSENESRSSDCLSKGCEFLKRTRKGDLHWRVVFAYLNRNLQVVVKSQGKYMGGAIIKNKKRLVLDVYDNIPSWPEREVLNDGEKRWYFGIKTDNGVMELECKNEEDHRLWTEGITNLLSHAQNQKQR